MKYELDAKTQLVLDFFSEYFEVDFDYLLSQLILDGIGMLISQCDHDKYVPITNFEFPDFFGEKIENYIERLESVQLKHLQRKLIAETGKVAHPRNVVTISSICRTPNHRLAA